MYKRQVLDGSIIRYEREMGVKVSLGHSADNIIGVDMVVYSAAISKDNVEPVSYTHLDVYKRQVQQGAHIAVLVGAQLALHGHADETHAVLLRKAGIAVPVSYTHLFFDFTKVECLCQAHHLGHRALGRAEEGAAAAVEACLLYTSRCV